LCSASWANDQPLRPILKSPYYLTSFPLNAFREIGAALRTGYCPRRVARTAERTMDVWTCFGLFKQIFILHQFLMRSLSELDIFRLLRTAACAGAFSPRVACTALRTNPFHLNVTKRLARHINCFLEGLLSLLICDFIIHTFQEITITLPDRAAFSKPRIVSLRRGHSLPDEAISDSA
jgi:hypothetical protein